MKKTILITAIITMAVATKAQQLQTSSMYDLQGVLHNPSLAGVQQDPGVKGIAGANYRTQWSGIEGAPRTITVFGSFALPAYKIGIGGYIYNDKTGPTSRTGLELSLAKHIHMSNDAVFSLGIETRLQQYSINKGKLAETLGNDPVLGSSDNRIKFDAGFGISFTNKNLQLGASVSQLVQSKLKFYSGNMATTEEAQLYRHYYFHGKYNWNVDGFTTITPHAMAIYLPNAPLDLMGGVRVEHNRLLWWGLGYRLHQSWLISAGFHIKKKITIGYAYDVYKTPISDFDGGHSAHEIMLRYNFLR